MELNAGIILAIPIIIATAIHIAIRSESMWNKLQPLKNSPAGGWIASTKLKNSLMGFAFWTIVALVVGQVAVYVYVTFFYNYYNNYSSASVIGFFVLAMLVSCMACCVVLRPMGEQKRHPFAFEWIVQCFILGIGYGLLVPALNYGIA